jgi:nucleotide-binding universal stress UspA family protein
MNFLIATDLSKNSSHALNYGLNLADLFQANVHVVHIVPLFTGVDNNVYNAFDYDGYLDMKKTSIQKQVNRLVKKHSFNIPSIKLHVEIGYFIPDVTSYCKKENIDLLLLGFTGTGSVERMVLGSSAGAMISSSTTPLLIIPHKAKIEKIQDGFTMATDFKINLNQKSHSILDAFIDKFQNKIQALHVDENEKENQAGETKLKALLGANLSRFDYIKSDNPVEAINDYANKNKTGLLIMISHHYSFFQKLFRKNLASEISSITTVPLLVLVE